MTRGAMSLPQHLAIIMDGNGRWAQQRQLPRIAGHQQGVKVVRTVVQECARRGIAYLTLYAFSSENWQRPMTEVDALMGLLDYYLDVELPLLQQQGIRLQVIGDLDRLPPSLAQRVRQQVASTATNPGMVLTLALSYGARDELVRAVRRLLTDARRKDISAEALDETLLASYLDTAVMPDPDLLIRTSGEMRISNFLLWQLAYTELYFCSCYWPDFDVAALDRALADFSRRSRRFGQAGDFEPTSRLGES
ncbi:MAG: isoprenyl transferase [Desulfuromonas sp.]